MAIDCDESNIDEGLDKLSRVASVHFDWLDRIGMCCNRSKTEFIAFDKRSRFRNKIIKIGADSIKAVDSMKILGMIFQDNLGWTKQISKSIASANSMLASLRYINMFVSREQFRLATNAHYVSKLTYNSTVWNKSISAKDRSRLSVSLNRLAKMNCKKYEKRISNRTLYEAAGLRSLTSLCTIADCTMLYKLCTGLSEEPLCERLMSQCYTKDRFPNRMKFFDYSQTRIGKNSFVNRARFVSELIIFDWINLTPVKFKMKIRDRTPLFMK